MNQKGAEKASNALSLSLIGSVMLGTMLAMAQTGAAQARHVYHLDDGLPTASVVGERIAFMSEGAHVAAPRGFTQLCSRSPDLCAAPRSAAAQQVLSTMTTEVMAQLQRYNKAVNAQYEPANDIDIHGVSDHWSLPTIFADCEDYVLAKRQGLIAAGWAPNALLIGVVRGEISDYHAVLILRTNRGEFVLDNMRDEVLPWRATGYDWVVRQSSENPMRWVRIGAEPVYGSF